MTENFDQTTNFSVDNFFRNWSCEFKRNTTVVVVVVVVVVVLTTTNKSYLLPSSKLRFLDFAVPDAVSSHIARDLRNGSFEIFRN